MAQVNWIGQSLGGRYQIEERLGQGGMSAVYKATDRNLRRVVAVKMIHPHLSDNQEFVRRFEEEAAAVAQLRHPNIIQVFDFNHDGDTYYMVLEFVPGETLAERLRRLNEQNRRMAPAEAAGLFAQVADALQYAHERGLIHRDVKPANIMLDLQGKATLMDFGIAKIMGGQLHTATGAIVGTAMYMSPEQIIGEKADERSDVYSLGVTLFETLAGRPPFQSESPMAMMMMHINDPVPDLRALNPQVSEQLARVVETALEKKREQRFQTCREMSAALREIQARGVGEAQPAADSTRPVDRTMLESRPGSAVSTQARQTSPTGYPAPVPGAGAPSAQGPILTPPPDWAGAVKKPARHTALRLLVGGGVGLFGLGLIAVVLLFALGKNLGSARSTPTPTDALLSSQAAEETATSEALLAASRPAPTALPLIFPTSIPAAKDTAAPPADTPTPASSPTPTVPAGRDYVRIDSINLLDGRYVVEYETFGYTEKLPGEHVHFFFNTVKPEQAGMPGAGPWIVYGGPRPFTRYTVTDRPAQATQLCALVANPNHSVKPDSGNCVDLPNP